MTKQTLQVNKKYVVVAIATGSDTYVSEILEFSGKNEEEIREECGLWYSRNINHNYCLDPWRYLYVKDSPEKAQSCLSYSIGRKNQRRLTKKRKYTMLCQLVVITCLNLLTIRCLAIGEKELSLFPAVGMVIATACLFDSVLYSETQSGFFREDKKD